ncbi:MAG TPA: AAA family ATPase [Ginsengibacter sp.]
MLKFYETYQRYNIPEGLKDDIYNTEGEKLSIIQNISKINIFIGANNSGKSKLIRELIRQQPINYYGNENWKNISELINKIFEIALRKLYEVESKKFFIISNSENGEIFNTQDLHQLNKRLIQYSSDYNLENTINELEFKFIKLPSSISRNRSFYVQQIDSNKNAISDELTNSYLKKFDEIKNETAPLIEELKTFQFSTLAKPGTARIYIPSIRTLRPFATAVNLIDYTSKEYQFPQHVSIYNGQDFPLEVLTLTTTKFARKQKLKQFEELLSKEFFSSKNVVLTYDGEDKVLLIKIGDEIEKPIYDLGDGLQMIIILLFPFFNHNSGFIAIEEPELFIHPGLQKTFMKFLSSHPQTENFQIFLATHSNHIIDSINQSDVVSLFSIRRREKKKNDALELNPDFILDSLAYGHENFLNLLGVTATSVYLSNCTIWVEGITDRLYLQKYILEYLKSDGIDSKYKICKEYKEGINYSFALTGGDSIIHWDFSDETDYYENTKEIIVRKFCSKSLVIVDNDFGKNSKRKNLLKELLKDEFIELENPEIENFLSQEVINETLLTYPSVVKAVGDKKLPIVERDRFKLKKIGFIIDNLILKDYPSVKKFATNENNKSSLKSGDKFMFCDKALSFIKSSNLTKETIDLVKKILDFIISHNQ